MWARQHGIKVCRKVESYCTDENYGHKEKKVEYSNSQRQFGVLSIRKGAAVVLLGRDVRDNTFEKKGQ